MQEKGEGMESLAVAPLFTENDSALDDHKEMLKEVGVFCQSWYKEEHFVLGDQLTPWMAYRQAMMHYDNKAHDYADAQANCRKVVEGLNRLSIKERIIDRIIAKIEGATHPDHILGLSSFSFNMPEPPDKTETITFDPREIIASFDIDMNDEMEACKEALLADAKSVRAILANHILQAQRQQMKLEKLVKDAEVIIGNYQRAIPELRAAAKATGLTPEQEEQEVYWPARQQRYIECKHLEGVTGVAHDYWASISNMPEKDRKGLIAFACENKARLHKQLQETNGVLPDSFQYQEKTSDLLRLACEAESKKLLESSEA